MNLALKDVRHNLGRFALTTGGVGLLLMIVMAMGGIYRGIVEDATLLVERLDADLWVVQRDTRGPFAEVSRLPRNLVDRVRVVRGVSQTRGFVFHTIQRPNPIDPAGPPLRMAVLGLDWPQDRGDWLTLTAGRPLARNHFEMIADRSLGLSLDQSLRLGKERYRVVGTTRDMMASSGDGLAFLTLTDALAIQFDTPAEAIRLERASRMVRGDRDEATAIQPSLLERIAQPNAELPVFSPTPLSAVLVQLEPGANADQVARTLDAWGDVTVYTQEDQRQLLLTGNVEKVRRQIGLFRGLLTVIAAIIMALILYTLTLDKLHSIALLKLLGAPNRMIVGLILQQALILGGLGYGIALLIGRRLFPMFPRRVILDNGDLLQLAAIVLVISVLASGLGVIKAMRVSPNEALS